MGTYFAYKVGIYSECVATAKFIPTRKAVVSICQVLVVDSVFIIFTRNVDRKANCDGTRPTEICHQQKKSSCGGNVFKIGECG